MGTVRGTFDLNSRPASSALRTLRKEGAETDAVMRNVGEALDGVGTTKQREQIRLYREQVKRLGRDFGTTATKQGTAWDRMERKTVKAVATQSTAIDSLQGRLNELGRTRATAEINTSGIAESLAEVELLKKRLNELDRMRATARVGVGGSTLGRAASGGGGGGGSGSAVRSLTLGPLSLGRAGYPAVIAGALGATPPLLGAATGVLGSASAGALGAGALGLGGLGALSAGIGSLAAVAIPAVKGISESHKALMAYNKAVAQNGKNSTQAHTALEKLNAALQSAPSGTRGLLNREQRLSSRFQRLTEPGQESFIGSLSNFLGAGNRLTPQLAGITNPFMAAGERQSGRLSGFLTGGTTRGFLGAAGRTATEVLPDVESTFQHVLATLMNISRASMPFFKQSVEWLERWTGGWAGSTGDIDKTRRSIGGMVSQLKTWGRLTAATFNLLKDLFSASARPGQSLVSELTKQLNAWDDWVKKNPRQVRAFFRDAVDSTEKIAGALGRIARMLWRLGQLVTPLLTQLSEFVGFLDTMGLLTPGGLPLLIASGAGVRNASRGLGAQIRGGVGGGVPGTAGTTTGAPLIVGGGAAAAGGAVRGGRYFRDTYRLARDFGYGRAASTVAGVGAAGMGPRPTAFARGFAGRIGPLVGLSAGLGALSTPGNLEERLSAGLSFGLTAPLPTGAEREDKGYKQGAFIVRQIAKRGGALKKQEAALRAAIRRTRGMEGESYADRHPDSLIGMFGAQEDSLSDEEREARLRTLGGARRQLKGTRKRASESAGFKASNDYLQAFQIRAKHGGAQDAMEKISGPILSDIKRLGPAGGRVLAQNVASWAAAAKRQNPKLRDEYKELAQNIETTFARMGQRIRIINGEIHTGSRKEWRGISEALINPVEKARQDVMKAFTDIQRQAIGSLIAMGYDRATAVKIVQGMERGDKGAERAAKADPLSGQVAPGKLDPHYRNPPKGARGMRIPGYGNTDHVPVEGLAAPGELILNGHTEARANGLLRFFGTSLEDMQRKERYRHSTPVGQMYDRPGRNRRHDHAFGGRAFARGGRPGRRYPDAMGALPGLDALAWVLKRKFGLQVTSGLRPGAITTSGNPSDHGWGGAIDVSNGVTTPQMDAAHAWLERRLGPAMKQMLYRTMVGGNHFDHIHVALNQPYASNPDLLMRLLTGGRAGMMGMGGMRGGRGGFGGGRALKLDVPGIGGRGAPGALARRAAEAMTGGLEAKVNQRLGRGRGRRRGARVSGGSIPAQVARILLNHGYNRTAAAGIIGNAYAESSWNPGAVGMGGGGLWGFTVSPVSLADVQAFASQRGQPWDSAALQTQFLLRHVSGGLRSRLNASPTPEAAAALFMSEWERPGIPRQEVRESAARKALRMFARGGRAPRFGGWHARGGSGSIDRPTLLGVGEGLGREDVEIKPHRPARKRAGGRRRSRGSVAVSFAGANFHVRRESDIEKIADAVGRKLADAMDEDDGIDEEEVMG